MKKLFVFVALMMSTMLISCGNASTADVVDEAPAAIEEVVEETTSEVANEEGTKEEVVKEDNENAENITANETEAVVEKQEVEEVTKEEKETVAEETNEVKEEVSQEKTYNADDIQLYDKEVVYYAQQSVNVRKGPGTDFDKVGNLKINDELKVLGESKTTPWKEVSYNGEIAFVHGDFIGTEKIDLEAIKAQQLEEQAKLAEQQAQAQAAAQVQAPAPAAVEVPPQPTIDNPVKTLFIGDSRTCQMQSATGGAGVSWICEYGTSYDWYRDTAVPKADGMVGKGTRVVICMGVNDPGSLNNYASLTNQKAAEWVARGASVYYVSLNPVDHPYEDKTPQIDSFNAQMPSMLGGVRWIDTASTVKKGGFVLEDGIHYDTAGNITIFNMIYGCLK